MSNDVDKHSEQDSDMELVVQCLAAGKPVPADAARRIQARAAEARKAVLATHGVQDIGVDIIRDIRGELPNA